jgi:hypothetical protein
MKIIITRSIQNSTEPLPYKDWGIRGKNVCIINKDLTFVSIWCKLNLCVFDSEIQEKKNAVCIEKNITNVNFIIMTTTKIMTPPKQ